MISLPLRLATLLLGPVLVACAGAAAPGKIAPADADPDTDATASAGWYASGRFQPCGKAGLAVIDPGELDRALAAADLTGGEPVYVRIAMREESGGVRVVRILQVGSPTPVRDCPMTGTTTN